jgi:hypothetical protein
VAVTELHRGHSPGGVVGKAVGVLQ